MKNLILKNKFLYFFYKIKKIFFNSKKNSHLGEFGEDIFVRRFFKKKAKGFYVVVVVIGAVVVVDLATVVVVDSSLVLLSSDSDNFVGKGVSIFELSDSLILVIGVDSACWLISSRATLTASSVSTRKSCSDTP